VCAGLQAVLGGSVGPVLGAGDCGAGCRNIRN